MSEISLKSCVKHAVFKPPWRFNFYTCSDTVCLLQKLLSQKVLRQKTSTQLAKLTPVHEISTGDFGSKQQTPKKYCYNKSAISIMFVPIGDFSSHMAALHLGVGHNSTVQSRTSAQDGLNYMQQTMQALTPSQSPHLHFPVYINKHAEANK